MPTTYLELFGADLRENELFQCVSILLTGTSTAQNIKIFISLESLRLGQSIENI